MNFNPSTADDSGNRFHFAELGSDRFADSTKHISNYSFAHNECDVTAYKQWQRAIFNTVRWLFFNHPRMRRVCLSVCPVRALAFEALT